jgi:hypothetical protein
VPVLALDISGRRQVFVESPADVTICTRLYDLLRPILVSERSLTFIATGAKNKTTGTDDNTGVDRVVATLKSLVDDGNQTVFGLVDGDGHTGKARQTDESRRLAVFANGQRDGLENCIYDPMILLLVIARHAKQEFARMGLPPYSDPDIAAMDQAQQQSAIDTLQTYILGEPAHDVVASLVNYHGGRRLNVRQDYLLHDDHTLSDLVDEKLPALKGYGSGNSAARMAKIVEQDLSAYRNYIPSDLIDTFRWLLEAEPHITANNASGISATA